MRAYVTAAGMAFGLVVVWAALVPFVAWDRGWAPGARACGQGPCGAVSLDTRPVFSGARQYGSEVIHLLRLRPKARRIQQWANSTLLHLPVRRRTDATSAIISCSGGWRRGGMTGSTMHLAVGLHRRDFAAQFRSDAARHPSRLLRGSPSACGAGPCAPATVASMDKLSVVLVAVFAGLPLAWRDG